MKHEAFDRVKNQMGPCGISCGGCALGNGTVAESAEKLNQFIRSYGIAQWAHFVPGGSEIDFKNLDHSLEWIGSLVDCPGCEHGGGPPNCTIRICSKERGLNLCSQCTDLEGCENFQWLGEHGGLLKAKLAEARGKNKKDLIAESIRGI
ncbi:MAG: DUF3795 domain-containing protein [Methanomassiliicoccales archaeon]|nr:DUF3795 domain-containing protein [Methanomassiliicoccales archaeon]